MLAGVVCGGVIVPRMLSFCRADVGPLFSESGVYPIGGLIDVSDVSLLSVRVAHHNHRRKFSQTLSDKPAQDIWCLVRDAQPIELINAL